MSVVAIVRIIWMISALGVTIMVLLHSPKGDGIAAIGGQAQLFTSTKSAEVSLNRITWALTLVFLSLTVALSAGWFK